MIIKNYYTGPLAVNCYVVTDEKTKKTFMVDPGGHNLDMVNHIKNNGFVLEYIILTHAHGDHMGGVTGILEEFPDAKLVACIHDKALLEDANLNMSTMVYGYPVTFSADRYVTDGETMKVGELNSGLSSLLAILRAECASWWRMSCSAAIPCLNNP